VQGTWDKTLDGVIEDKVKDLTCLMIGLEFT
jgi:hypothetical protein